MTKKNRRGKNDPSLRDAEASFQSKQTSKTFSYAWSNAPTSTELPEGDHTWETHTSPGLPVSVSCIACGIAHRRVCVKLRCGHSGCEPCLASWFQDCLNMCSHANNLCCPAGCKLPEEFPEANRNIPLWCTYPLVLLVGKFGNQVNIQAMRAFYAESRVERPFWPLLPAAVVMYVLIAFVVWDDLPGNSAVSFTLEPNVLNYGMIPSPIHVFGPLYMFPWTTLFALLYIACHNSVTGYNGDPSFGTWGTVAGRFVSVNCAATWAFPLVMSLLPMFGVTTCPERGNPWMCADVWVSPFPSWGTGWQELLRFALQNFAGPLWTLCLFFRMRAVNCAGKLLNLIGFWMVVRIARIGRYHVFGFAGYLAVKVRHFAISFVINPVNVLQAPKRWPGILLKCGRNLTTFFFLMCLLSSIPVWIREFSAEFLMLGFGVRLAFYSPSWNFRHFMDEDIRYYLKRRAAYAGDGRLWRPPTTTANCTSNAQEVLRKEKQIEKEKEAFLRQKANQEEIMRRQKEKKERKQHSQAIREKQEQEQAIREKQEQEQAIREKQEQEEMKERSRKTKEKEKVDISDPPNALSPLLRKKKKIRKEVRADDLPPDHVYRFDDVD